jgi:Flp pilus assembly protein TadG
MRNYLQAHLLTPLRCRRGAIAVEFALAAMPFIFMLFAIIESGLIFVAQVDLSNATMNVARQVRTGNLMAAGNTSTTTGLTLSLADFKTAICKSMNFIPVNTCTAQLQIDMRTQSTFGSGQAAAVPIVNLNFNNSALCYYSGQSGSIVELRAFYLWTVNTPLILSALINAKSYTVGTTTTNGNYHVITSAEAFRVEQNSSGTNTGSGC